MDFLQIVNEKAKLVKIDEKLLARAVNEGFSGGEKKLTKYSRWPC